ncbi:hypothetical protein AL552_24120 [Vibrio diabolicus]|nr:hypothetical protein AL552_24120 [Vibrio diabolicus]
MRKGSWSKSLIFRQRKTPRAYARRGYSLTRSNPATKKCSMHQILDSVLHSFSLILSSPS